MNQEELIQDWLDSSGQNYLFLPKKHSCYQRDSSLATGKDKRVIREEVKRYISLLQDRNTLPKNFIQQSVVIPRFLSRPKTSSCYPMK